MSIYNHAEAFCLMHYKCDTCGLLDHVWNSRDGVTPFCISCVSCGGLSRHDMLCHPPVISIDVLPETATRVFVNMTKRDAVQSAQKWLAKIKELKSLSFSLKHYTDEELLKKREKELLGDGTNPYTISRREYLARTKG